MHLILAQRLVGTLQVIVDSECAGDGGGVVFALAHHRALSGRDLIIEPCCQADGDFVFGMAHDVSGQRHP